MTARGAKDASRSFPVAVNRVQIACTKLMTVLEWTDTAGILQLEFVSSHISDRTMPP